VAKAGHFKLDQTAPVAKIEDLANYDAIIIGGPTRFRPDVRTDDRLSGPRRRPLGEGARSNGKVGSAFTSTASQHGGQEMNLFSTITNLLHFGNGSRGPALQLQWSD